VDDSKADGSQMVKNFFERRAGAFDRYYLGKEKFLWEKIPDFIFRRSIKRRFDLTLKECAKEKNLRILDVGCGSGRCAVELAKQGHMVVGVDFSEQMIRLARTLAQENGASGSCHFICGDFLEMDFHEEFDVCIALGFFDYTKNPSTYLSKMKKLARRKIIVSFPAKWRLRNLVRIARLKYLNCPVYFYTSQKIKNIFTVAKIFNYSTRSLGRDYWVATK